MSGGGQQGERNHRARLSDEDVREIRRQALNRWETQTNLARRFGVAESAISRIVNRQRWTHIQ